MKKMNGFTLIEMMIVVAIVSILAAIAIPSYQSSVTKSRRGDATAVLQGLAQAMERLYTETGTYVGADPATIYSAKSPVDGSATYYNLTIPTLTANAYSLLATPVNAQAGNGILTLTNTGLRGWDADNSGGVDAATEQCWETSC